jgi:hypothetical protein
LNFSPDGRYVRDGYLEWSYFDTSSMQKYQLDGTWQCKLDSGDIITVYVQFHSFSLGNMRSHFFINDDKKACFRMTHSLYVSDQEIQPNLNGPGVGEVFRFESEVGFGFEWTRVSMSLEGVSSVVRMKPLSSNMVRMGRQFIYQRINNDDCRSEQEIGPSYNGDSLWGNTFCQAFTVGLASYHFMKPNCSDDEYTAYISYEHPRVEQWPNLDNGEHVPSRVYFRNIQWNEQTRTFKGDILWVEDHDTTWTGDAKWVYEMRFDPTYKFISSGSCTMANKEPHQFGEDLVYINASLECVFSEALGTASSTEQFLDLLRDCRENGASEPTMQCLGEVAMTAMNRGHESCIDINL